MAGDKKDKKKFSRRDFVVVGGAAIAGGALTAATPGTLKAAETTAGKSEYALSRGYLVYDSRRCSGCLSCMLACSLVHEGEGSTSLSRIQIARNVFEPYPMDIQIFVCRQCPEPMCVKNCPTGACHVSEANGNVRIINAKDCIGCKTCINVCPYLPHRTIFNSVTNKSAKCDLCADSPYFSKRGGPSGAQACVDVCPANALKLTASLPEQRDNRGYDVNLAPPAKPAAAAPAPKT